MKKQIWRVTRDGKNFVGTGRFAGRHKECLECGGARWMLNSFTKNISSGTDTVKWKTQCRSCNPSACNKCHGDWLDPHSSALCDGCQSC